MSAVGKNKKAEAYILMGSDSDWPILEKAVAIFEKFGVSHEVFIASAHRTPKRVDRIVKRAEKEGVKLLLCAAGMAAHLAGAVAGKTTLPVIGIPISNPRLDGLDALLSTVQMPPGIPVATVGIDAAANAALLAISMLAISDKRLAEALKGYRLEMADGVSAKQKKLDGLRKKG